jgi:hypothetical protein
MRHVAFIIVASILASPAVAELSLTVDAPGLDLVPLTMLPDAPQDDSETEFCAHLFVETVSTPGGRDVAAKGWHVTAELPLGDLTAVSFVGSADPATSGTCELLDGNVGFYSGGQLVALLFATQSEQPLIGNLRPFGDGLRLLNGDLLPGSVADIMRDGDRIVVTAPAADEPVCTGAATVPGIEGLPIDQARKLLLQAGWQPVPGDPTQQALGWARDLAKAGVPEVQDCSGTGFAFCAFAYSGPSGTLTAITAGEGGDNGSLPAVTRYQVDCN